MANAFLMCDESGVENRPAKFLAANLLRAAMTFSVKTSSDSISLLDSKLTFR